MSIDTSDKSQGSLLFRVAAVIFLITAASVGWYASKYVNMVQSLRVDLSETKAQIVLLERQNTQVLQQFGELSHLHAAILAAPDLRTIILKAQPNADNAIGRVYWSNTEGILLSVSRLPPISEQNVYQLWLVIPPNPISAGIFTEALPEGYIFSRVDVPNNTTFPTAIALTLEPAGGVETPSGNVLLLGRPDQ